MNRYIFIIILLLLFAGTTILLRADNYYVNKSATGNNSGSSWNNGWISFPSINWNLISPGDTIFISVGSDLTVYY